MISKGPLDRIFAIDKIIFHWGSEHSLDNYRFDAEVCSMTCNITAIGYILYCINILIDANSSLR